MPVDPKELKKLSLAEYNDPTGEKLNDFLNSLFDPWPGPFAYNAANLFRSKLVEQIKEDAEKDGALITQPACWLVQDETLERLVDILQCYWLDAKKLEDTELSYILADKNFIRLVKDFIDTNDLMMRVPKLKCTKREANAPSPYELTGDDLYSFKKDDGGWNVETIRRFLKLLLAGAHFVVVHSNTDLGDKAKVANFFDPFSNLKGAGKAQHSHYTGWYKVAPSGRNYPQLALIEEEGDDLDKLADQGTACLLPVVLCDTTNHYYLDHNSFFQMEGWRPGRKMYGWTKYEYRNKALAGGYRHGADFATHQDTLWNISTYGASLYSEKRGAPIFLAPKEWMRKETHLYKGFSGNDGWFASKLVKGLLEGEKKEVLQAAQEAAKKDAQQDPNEELEKKDI